MDINTSILFDPVVDGVAIFFGSFIVLSIIWGMILRISESLFSKSKFYFIPKILKEVNRSVVLVMFLISIYLGISFYDESVMSGTLEKIWGIFFIITVIGIVARIILNILDRYYMETKKKATFLAGIIPLIKRVIGIILYGVAALLIIIHLSSDIGSVVALMGFLILIFLFIIYYEQLKNIIAGLQLVDSYIREGDYIEIDGNKGFVERVLNQYTIVRDLNGTSMTFPNSYLLKKPFRNSFFSDGNLMALEVEIEGNDLAETEKKLSVICGKTALKLENVFNDYKPKVFVTGVKDGKIKLIVNFIVVPNSNIRKIMNQFSLDISKEFKNKVSNIGLI